MVMPISTGGPEGGGNVMVGGGQIIEAVGGTGSRVVDGRGGIHIASSFGVNHTTMSGFSGRKFLMSARVRMLERRESYYSSTNHDHKQYDFDGRMIQPGAPMSQPLLSSSAEAAGYYVSLKLRRPHAPYRLARTIVNSFTALLFGYGRWPTIRVHGDPKSEDWINALAKSAKLRALMVRARNLGGSAGTVGISWCFYEGKPFVRIHNAKHLYVHTWEDRERCLPEHVTEAYTYPVDEYDPQRAQFVQNWYWYRRDWTPMADVVFRPALFQANADPLWEVDQEKTVFHGRKSPHFIWIQNLPEDDSSAVDGSPDYAELYESFDSIDILNSVVVRGATLNLDPTLVLKMDPDILARRVDGGIKKGSDNSLIVGETGDAHYMEMQGTSIQTGIDLLRKEREKALETSQCIVPDPNQIAAQGTSSVAIKTVYAPMLGKAEILREQYGEGMIRLLTGMFEEAKDAYEPTYEIDAETGEQTEIRKVISLPPRLEMVETSDPLTGLKTKQLQKTELEPGEGGEIELDWGDYFNPTSDDQQKFVTTITTAVTGAVMPQESGVEEVARMFGRNPLAEWKKVSKEGEKKDEKQASMFRDGGAFGGKVGGENDLPPGAQDDGDGGPPPGGGPPPPPHPGGGGPPPPPRPGGPPPPRG